MDVDFSGCGVVVTGGAQGIGLATARVLVESGASVVIADVDGEKAAAAAASLAGGGRGRAVGTECDVTDEQSVSAAVECAVRLGTPLTGWVNNAGVTRDATMRTMSVEMFRQVIEVHLVGMWLGLRASSAVMRKSGGGSIVNLSSISGKVGNIGQTNYSSAKAGVIGLTKAAAKELGHVGVRVNAVQPGVINTPMTAAMREDIRAARLAEVPLQRFGEPEEVANVIAFLLSPLSSYMTGNVLEVAGGRHM